jgi:hypothetical protein
VVNPQGKTLFEVFEAYQFQLPLPHQANLSVILTFLSPQLPYITI